MIGWVISPFIAEEVTENKVFFSSKVRRIEEGMRKCERGCPYCKFFISGHVTHSGCKLEVGLDTKIKLS